MIKIFVVVLIFLIILIILASFKVIKGSDEKGIINDIQEILNEYTDIKYYINKNYTPNPTETVFKKDKNAYAEYLNIKKNKCEGNVDINSFDESLIFYFDDYDKMLNELCIDNVDQTYYKYLHELTKFKNNNVSIKKYIQAYPLNLVIKKIQIKENYEDVENMLQWKDIYDDFYDNENITTSSNNSNSKIYTDLLFNYYSKMMPQLYIPTNFFEKSNYIISDSNAIIYNSFNEKVINEILKYDYMTIIVIDDVCYTQKDLNYSSNASHSFIAGHKYASANNIYPVCQYASISEDLMREQIHNPQKTLIYVKHTYNVIEYGLAYSGAYGDVNIQLKYMEYVGQINTNEIVKYIRQFKSDQHILTWLIMNVPMPKESYKKKAYKISGQIKNILYKFTDKNEMHKLKTYLDIGTIDQNQLKAIQESLKIKIANGINIDEGEGYLNYEWYEDVDNKITMYDGINIPVIQGVEQYDLISIFSVLHHIPQNILSQLIESIATRCKKGGYLVIKDNDLVNEHSIIYFKWQHLIYSRKLYTVSYLRYDMTLNFVKKILHPYFEFVGCDLNKEYVRTYFAIFRRI